MATMNLDQTPSISKDILPPGSTPSSQLGFSLVNLSNTHLTKDHISALEKGLTFCPIPRSPDTTHLWNDIEEFFRRLRIKRYFDKILTDDSERSPFNVKSTWTPPEGQDSS